MLMRNRQVIVVYDSDCGFCRWCAAMLKSWDKAERLCLVPAAQALSLQLHPQLTPKRCQQALQVILPDGQLLSGWDGLTAVAMRLPSLRWLGQLGALPLMRVVGRTFYRFVATHRCRRRCKV